MATGDEDFGPYEGLLHQADIWPSTTRGQMEPILDMSPQHAIAAYRKLCRWAERYPVLDPMKDYLLGAALIQQALGHACGQEVYHPFEALEEDELLEVLIEASEQSATADAVTHYRNARAVMTYLDDHQVVVFRSTPTGGS